MKLITNDYNSTDILKVYNFKNELINFYFSGYGIDDGIEILVGYFKEDKELIKIRKKHNNDMDAIYEYLKLKDDDE